MKNLSFLHSRWFALLHDVLWIPVALILAYWVRFNLGAVPDIYWEEIVQIVVVSLFFQTACYWYFGLYRGIWRFASIPDLFRILKAITVGAGLSFLCVFLFTRLSTFPRSILILYPLFLFMGLSAPRLLYRWYKDKHVYLSAERQKRVLIVGAGRAGEMLARSMLRDKELVPVGFVDDDVHKINRDIHGINVIDNIDSLNTVLQRTAAELVVVSIRNISAGPMKSILRICNDNNVECQTIPSLIDINDENIDLSLLRRIKIEDLLGREVIKLDDKELRNFISNKCILVTGAGGSIGSELSRQVLKYMPNKLILLEQSEFNLYEITKNVIRMNSEEETKILSVLCDIRDSASVEAVFLEHRPSIVFHAAAYKHVPILEENAIEGVKTNLFGTKNLAEVAANFNVEKFVMVSTDKAVNPTSMMGATKRAAEIFCQTIGEQTTTKYITTRFGNVLDSTGSVVPLFREQIKNGGPVTVTHKDISRYFMSIPEAASLILQAASMGEGGEIFVLDMGKPVKIYDLARQMIRLSGYDPDQDIKIEIVGLRPGEKLYEELFHASENHTGTKHPKILLADSRKIDWDKFSIQLEDVHNACEQRDLDTLVNSLTAIIPEYSQDQLLTTDDIIEDPRANIVH